jgi:serine/threonine-protein kinase
VTGLCLASAAIASVVAWNLKPANALPHPRVARFTITLPPDQHLPLDWPALSLSPDGHQLVYSAVDRTGRQRLYFRSMDRLDSNPVPETDGGFNPVFSADGQSIAFFAGLKLKRIGLNGGSVLTLTNAVAPRGATWDGRGALIFAPTANSVLRRIAEMGGNADPMTRLETDDTGHRWPFVLPNGNAVLYAAAAYPDPWVAVQPFAHGDRRNVTRGTSPQYAVSGHLIYGQEGNLMAMPFDAQRLTATGAPMPVVDKVSYTDQGLYQYCISATGTLAYIAGLAQNRTLLWVSRSGREEPIAAPPRTYSIPRPRLSPDGRQIAIVSDGQIWLYDLSGETLTRFTVEGNGNTSPTWTPDGKRIAFSSVVAGHQNLFWQAADGTGRPERLTSSELPQYLGSFSPDGQLLAFPEISPATGYDINILRLTDRIVRPFLRTAFAEAAPAFSPDGHWLAYVSDESGGLDIYIRPYPGPGGKRQVSIDGGVEPVWNRNGRELFYRSGNKMMAVAITTEPVFTAGKPQVLFEGHYVSAPGTLPAYDVSSDGQRFLMLKAIEQPSNQVNIVLNWFEELKGRVPTR